jgi:hypothetical protein
MMINEHPRVRASLNRAVILSLLLLTGYTLIYLSEPFNILGNNLILSIFTILSSAAAAGTASMVYLSYESDESPKLVWKNFSYGFWLWVIAEIVYAVEDIFLVGAFTIPVARFLWFCGFIFFTLALYQQYQIIYGYSKTKRSIYLVIVIWVTIAIMVLLILWLSGQSISVNAFLEMFNSIANLVVGIIALMLLLTFRGGIIARPWWGFLGFSIADVLYFVVQQAGSINGPLLFSNFMGLLTRLIYLLAYLVLAIGFYAQYLLLKFGIDPLGNSTDD